VTHSREEESAFGDLSSSQHQLTRTSSRNIEARPRAFMPDDASAEAAEEAALRYVSDQVPGIRRIRAGKSFRYQDTDGRAVRNPNVLSRIKSLAIPPAWSDVWICPRPNGHVQATGRDAKGRKQHRYHSRWREVRDAKYDRLLDFAEVLQRIRRRVARDLRRPGLPREKIPGAVVRLLDTTHIRVGNEVYARDSDSFGLTTMRSRHVEIGRGDILLRVPQEVGKATLGADP
jgi:DNA topoisomerase-1